MLWLKVLHIVFVIGWFVGLFYLPRLFVYHAQATDGTVMQTLEVMETKLYRFSSLLMLGSLISGILLLMPNVVANLAMPWLQLKLFLVVLLVGYHHGCGALRKRFARGENRRSHVFYRWFNEVPLLFLLAIITLVVFRPG